MFASRQIIIYILVLISVCYALAKGNWNTDEARVLSKILDGYDKNARPESGNSNKTEIHLSMTLSQVIAVSEKTEAMTTSIYMIHTWYDYRLMWNESEYGGVNVSRVPADDVWVPRIILQNSKDDKFDVSLRTDVLVYPNGMMEWMPPSLYISSCEIEVSLFPFDWQNCSMIFRSLSHDSDEMTLTADDYITIDKSAFQENGEWDLISKPISTAMTYRGNVPYDDVIFYFILQRRPQFYIMNLIVPCILMMTFSCFTFFLPAVSAQKMTLSVSTLLGETVFLFLIAQRMPETSRSIPLIVAYLIFSMALIINCVVFSVIVCNVHFRSSTTHRMPHWMGKYLMGHVARLLKVQRPIPSSPWQLAMERRRKRLKELAAKDAKASRSAWRAPSEMLFDNKAKRYGFRTRHIQDMTGFTEVTPAANGKVESSAIPAALLPVPDKYKPAVDGVNWISNHVKDKEIKAQSCDDWEYCALILDRVFFWIYMSAFILGTVAFFIRISVAYYPKPDPPDEQKEISTFFYGIFAM
uniref:acetylcholine receptor subunit beta-like n=1 Tax=Styela clava TaxID=7725 RepID=UPI001939D54F|nr:acetylcholine receptor subunit beta-like [Styela clava]